MPKEKNADVLPTIRIECQYRFRSRLNPFPIRLPWRGTSSRNYSMCALKVQRWADIPRLCTTELIGFSREVAGYLPRNLKLSRAHTLNSNQKRGSQLLASPNDETPYFSTSYQDVKGSFITLDYRNDNSDHSLWFRGSDISGITLSSTETHTNNMADAKDFPPATMRACKI